ncbi:MAG: NADH-quinone oxidoreductase subunit A [Candidatus Krumholzibacteriia bacterium]
MMEAYLPVLMVLAAATAFSGLFIGLSYWLGPNRPQALKETTYECGIPPRGTIQIRFFVRFFLVALLFLLFDLEAVFLYPWVIVYNSFVDAGHAAYALGTAGVFLLVLVVGLVYEWKKGGLEWQ